MARSAPVFMKSKRKPWQNNSDDKRLLKGRALQRARKELFQANPLCAECKRQGRVTIATIRDHIVALAFGGKDEPENCQGLCKACHDTKTANESRGGVAVNFSR